MPYCHAHLSATGRAHVKSRAARPSLLVARPPWQGLRVDIDHRYRFALGIPARLIVPGLSTVPAWRGTGAAWCIHFGAREE